MAERSNARGVQMWSTFRLEHIRLDGNTAVQGLLAKGNMQRYLKLVACTS
jgi:hypothetical protein